MLSSGGLRWPRLLAPGGTVGVCAPCGPVEPAFLQAAVALLQARGYRVVVAPHAREVHPAYDYLAGADDGRVADLNALLGDSAVDMVLCARGGYGAMRLLSSLDFACVRADPKPLVGFSDVTALQLALAARAEVVSFSGIMATAGHGLGEPTLDAWSEAGLWAAVGEGSFPRVFAPPPEAAPWQTVRLGKGPVVAGPVYPVCLTLLNALLGTPFVPDLKGAILVIEDVGESLYKIDRYLTQLGLAGVLDDLTALLVGAFARTDEAETRALPGLVRERTPDSVAVATGVAYGHIARRLTLPVGAWGEVNLDRGTFTFAG